MRFEHLANDLIEQLVVAGVATIITACVARYWAKDILRERLEVLRSFLFGLSHSPAVARPSYAKSLAILLKKIRLDQSKSGPHYGQFGRRSDTKDEARYQSNAEDIQTKPRMYLTLWPTTILIKRKRLPYSVELAVRGVKRLVVNGRIPVFQSAVCDMSPIHQPIVISYRHTMCAALFFSIVDGWSLSVTNVLGEMLDSRAKWQNADGGWAQCDHEHTQSDLWASTYAARLLFSATKQPGLPPTTHELAEAALQRTLTFFRDAWLRDRWKVGSVSSEENAPYIFLELAPIIRRYDKTLFNDVLSVTRSWFTPAGDLTTGYLSSCAGSSPFSCYVRIAYGMSRAGIDKSDWLPLLERALHRLEEASTSADAAFAFDLICSITEASERAQIILSSDDNRI